MKYQHFWNTQRYLKSIDNRKGQESFVFMTAPNCKWPSYMLCSWKSNQGFSCKIKNYARFYVERKAGWDTHGLPVELEVEKKLELKENKTLKSME